MDPQKPGSFKFSRLLVILVSLGLVLAAAASIDVEVAQAGDCTLSHSVSWFFGSDGRVNISTNHSSRCTTGTHKVRGTNKVNGTPGGACWGNIASPGATSSCSTPYISYPGNRQNVVDGYTEAWKYNSVTKTWNWHQGPKVCQWIIDPPGHGPEPTDSMLRASNCSG